MEDLKPLFWIIFFAIYLISRFFRKPKKQQGMEPGQPPGQPTVVEQPESLFDTLREEIRRQKEMERAKQKQKQQQPAPQRKVVKAAPKKTVQKTKPADWMTELNSLENEGVSVFKEKMKTVAINEEVEEIPAFEFDPREAFKIKTLLDKHPMV